MATNQRSTSKLFIALLCLLAQDAWVGATTQTSYNQDKPPSVYVESYTLSDSGSCILYLAPGEDGKNTVTFNGSVPTCGEGGAGTASWVSHYESTGTFIQSDGTAVPYDDTGDFNIGWSWPISASWPIASAAGSESYNITYSPPTVPNESGSFNYNGQSPPIYWEHCDINTSSNFYVGVDRIETHERRTAQAILKLRTGGKGTSKLRNLFELSGDVWEVIPNNPYDVYIGMNWNFGYSGGSDYLFERNDGGTQDFTTEASFGGVGNLDYNGWYGTLYKVLPDNTEVDVTPNVPGANYYSFYLSAEKYNSYLDINVQQAFPGFSLLFANPIGGNDVGHAFWQFRTDAPEDALQYVSTNLTVFLGHPWGFYPTEGLSGLFTDPGYLQDDGSHSYNIKRTFYIGFPDLIQGLEYTKQLSNAPPVYTLSGFNCVSAARDAGSAANVHGLPWDMSPQNFGVSLIEMYPAPGQINAPFIDTNDIFYSLQFVPPPGE